MLAKVWLGADATDATIAIGANADSKRIVATAFGTGCQYQDSKDEANLF